MPLPKASVLMPVYNAGPYLKEAISSILEQTFEDFEFLIFNDGSTDNSEEILRSCNDPRIRLFLQNENTGYVRLLNRGIEIARGKYIFRMDADDISLPDRLERQIAFMDRNPEVGLCGSWVKTIDDLSKIVRRPVTHEEIVLSLLNSSTIYHPSAVIRKSVLRDHKLKYDESFLYAEDHDLWIRMARVTKLAILPEVLLLYRIHADSVSSKYIGKQTELVNTLRVRQFERLLGRRLKPTEKVWATLSINFNYRVPLPQIAALKKEIIAANNTQKIYDPDLLKPFLLRRTAKMYNRHQITRYPLHLWNSLLLQLTFPGISTYMRSFFLGPFLRSIRRNLNLISDLPNPPLFI